MPLPRLQMIRNLLFLLCNTLLITYLTASPVVAQKVKIKCDTLPKIEYMSIPLDDYGKLPCDGYVKRNHIDGTMKNCTLWEGKYYNFDSDGILIRVDIYKSGKWSGCLAEARDSIIVGKNYRDKTYLAEQGTVLRGTMHRHTKASISTGCSSFYLKASDGKTYWIASKSFELIDNVEKAVKLEVTSFPAAEGRSTCYSVVWIREVR